MTKSDESRLYADSEPLKTNGRKGGCDYSQLRGYYRHHQARKARTKTESEEEGNESEQEQDQRNAESSQGPTITPYIVRQNGDILQRIAQTRQELQETARQGALLSAALEHHRGTLQRMAHTPSHREHDPTQSKVRDLTFQFEQEAKENSASNQLRMTRKTDVEEKEPRKVSQKSDRVMMRKVLDPMPTDARRISLQNGTRLYQVIGDPWEIEGDGLLVFTNDNFKIHNTKFRKKLRAQAGEDYKKEVRELRRQVSQNKASKVLLTRRRLERVQRENVALDEGQNADINHGLRRVTICLDGLRSHDLPDASLTEIVIVTFLSQHESRRKRELALAERMDEKNPRDPPHLEIPRIQQGNKIKPHPDEKRYLYKSETNQASRLEKGPKSAKKDGAAPSTSVRAVERSLANCSLEDQDKTETS
ncbi:hypothetical protein CRENBAI_021451 [Crenichthys baileyi]|uniref:Uncharacterized protein n=1 Tax=Crenichthys baileyi TaxID=28760 RepID=A0AAV9RIA0_9TELE